MHIEVTRLIWTMNAVAGLYAVRTGYVLNPLRLTCGSGVSHAFVLYCKR
jgi:hypothetical protein